MPTLKRYDATAGEWEYIGGIGAGGDVPVGTVVAYWGADAPSGWLLCDGGAIPAGYSQLIALVGANTPNLKGRTLVGIDAAQTEFDVLGETGGAKTHTLTTAEMPVHTHVVGNASNLHNHVVQNVVGVTSTAHTHNLGTGQLASAPAGTGAQFTTSGSTGTENVSHNHAAQNAGSGQAHNNLQPYAAVNWIIKAEPGGGGGGGGAAGAGETDPLVFMGGF